VGGGAQESEEGAERPLVKILRLRLHMEHLGRRAGVFVNIFPLDIIS
jgi:hypothetical protein